MALKVTQKLPDEVRSKVIELRMSGMNPGAIFKELQIGNSTVTKILRESGLSFPPLSLPNTKVSIETEEAIVRLYAEGVEVDTIAAGLSVDRVTVFNVLKRNEIELGRHMSRSWRKYHIANEDCFEVIDSDEKAYFLGLLLTDGYQKGDRRIGISLQPQDSCLLERLKTFVGTTAPLKSRTTKLNGKTFHSVELTVCSVKMSDDLARWGVVKRKTYLAKYPDLGDRPDLHAGFIRGFFDGDGSIFLSKGRPFFCATGTLHLIQGVGAKLSQYAGVKNTAAPYTRNGKPAGGRIRLSGKKNLSRIYKFLYTNSSISLDRKREKIEAFLQGE